MSSAAEEWSPFVLAVAPNGARKTKADHPALPMSADEIARDAAECREAGASMIHLHVRDRNGGHSLDVELYRDAIRAVRREVGNRLIVQVTSESVGRYAPDQQMAMVRDLVPEAVSLAVRELVADPSQESVAAGFYDWARVTGIMVQHILYSEQDLAQFNQLVARGVIPGEAHCVLFVLGRYAKDQRSSPHDLLPFLTGGQDTHTWFVCAFWSYGNRLRCRWSSSRRACADRLREQPAFTVRGGCRLECGTGRRCGQGGGRARQANCRDRGRAGHNVLMTETSIPMKSLTRTALKAVLLAGLLGMFETTGDISSLAEEAQVVIGTAPVSGVYYPAGGAVCRLVNRTRVENSLRCFVEATDGSAENLSRLKAGDLDFAVLQSDWQYHAYQGSGGGVSDQPFSDLRAVFSMHPQTLTIVVARESDIQELADLEGKKVSLGPSGSAVQAASELLVESLGWTGDTFDEVLELGLEEQVDALCAGLIDAFILPVTHPNGIVAAATEGCLARLISVTGSPVDKLLLDWPFYARSTIPAGLYRGNPAQIDSFGLRATLVTTTAVPAETVYKLVKAVLDPVGPLTRQHPALQGLRAEQMISSGLSAPLHEGALLYYREMGWQ